MKASELLELVTALISTSTGLKHAKNAKITINGQKHCLVDEMFLEASGDLCASAAGSMARLLDGIHITVDTEGVYADRPTEKTESS